MAAKMERKLKSEAKKKGLSGGAFNRYVYGTMIKKADWKPKRKKRNGKK